MGDGPGHGIGASRLRRPDRLRGFGPGGGTACGARVERLAGAGDGESLLVQEALDLEDKFDVAAAVKALAGAALVGLELGELGFPEAEDVGLDGANAGDVADFEVEAVGDDRRLRCVFPGNLRCH